MVCAGAGHNGAGPEDFEVEDTDDDVRPLARTALQRFAEARLYARILLRGGSQKGACAVYKWLLNPRAHALGFFQPALGFLPIVAYFCRFLPWISLTNPWIFATIYTLTLTNQPTQCSNL